MTAAREEEEEQGEKHILEVGYEFIGLIARELLVGFIVKAVFIEGCMMIIALSVNGSRGCCGQAVNLLTRQLSSWLVQVGQIWIKPVANSSGFHIYILLLVDMGRWGVISQLPLCSSPLEPLRPRGGQSRLLSLLMAPRVTGMHLRCIFITDS